MLLGEIIQVALQAVRANKLRSLLTTLGIIIGVGAVITMIALGSGAQKAVQDRIQALGPTLLSLYPGQSFMRGVASDVRVSLTVDDDTALANNARYLTDVVPELTRNLQVQKGNQNLNVNVVGTRPNYVPVKNYTITAGRMFTDGDDAARRRVAVLGAAIPQMLNANRLAMIGQEIEIRGIPFEIVGVLAEKGSQGSFFNPDEQILIPLQTARYRVMGTDRLRSITVKVVDTRSMTLAMIEIERVLRRQHKLRPGQDNDFQIRNQTDILATLQQTTETFKYLLAGIAAVSLLVGGIGIMNIML
ncbi:MAG TPA: ABC transporter permease, partial [Gemmatimonadales bacterium]|nr:ABC transporter permease [Gemmatimonadales bacterium]